MGRRRGNVYRNRQVHVLAEQCATCIFRPGNLMELCPGRVRGMVAEATAKDLWDGPDTNLNWY
jgi:hypothetical protein